MKVYISPNPTEIRDDNGVGKVVHAQHRYLPEFGIEFVGHPEQADLIASHVWGDYLSRLDILHLHGMYFTGDEGSGEYLPAHFTTNARLIESCRKARRITMPSQWAGESLRRDMRLRPVTIYNGVDYDLWQDPEAKNLGYVLWNKNRAGDVCDPTPALELARRSGQLVVSTFAPVGVFDLPPNLKVIGRQSFETMSRVILNAGVYLSTTLEVFSVSVLENLAAGVPVLGYAWGGNLEVIRHKQEGYLVEPGDYDGLVVGLEWINANREELSQACRKRAQEFSWRLIMGQYAELYRSVLAERQAQKHRVTVVIPNYNYGRYLDEAVKSVLNQTRQPDELIIVDDGSTDNSAEVLSNLATDWPGIKIIRQPNMGVAAARNSGIAATDAEYIICLDADDAISPRYIETLLPALQSDPTLGVAWSKSVLVNENGQPTNQVWDWDFSWEQQSDVLNFKNGIPAGAMFRRAMWERAGGYKQVYHPAEDAEFWLRGLSVGFKAKRISDEPLFYYRTHEGSASQRKPFPNIHTWHPWSKDKLYPMGAPAKEQPLIRSYNRPLISVVIPVGPGHAKYLPTALESLLGQTFRNWSVIIANDSGEPLVGMLKPYPFAQVVTTAGAAGAGAARNLGLAQVKTPLVLFLDADDYLIPDALEKMVKAYIAHGGSKYVYTDCLFVTEDGLKERKVPDYDQHGWLKNGLHAVTVLMATEQAQQVGGFDETLSAWEDWEFFIKCAYAGFCGAHLAEPLLAYRIQTGQRRSDADKQKKELLALFNSRYEGKQVMGCCGGNKQALNAAQQSLGLLADGHELPAGATDEYVMCEFTGPQEAPVPYRVNGHTYTAGNNPDNRRVSVLRSDVEELISYPAWKIAENAGVR